MDKDRSSSKIRSLRINSEAALADLVADHRFRDFLSHGILRFFDDGERAASFALDYAGELIALLLSPMGEDVSKASEALVATFDDDVLFGLVRGALAEALLDGRYVDDFPAETVAKIRNLTALLDAIACQDISA